MKLLAYLKVSIKSIIKEFPTFIIAYGVFPIFLAFLMGFMLTDEFTPTFDNPLFSIVIVDEDNTISSNNLISFLKSEELSKVLTIEESDTEKFDYTLRIGRGYEDSLYGDTTAMVKVEAEEKSSTSLGNTLVNIVDKYNQEISQNLILQRNVDNKNLPKEERTILITEINDILSKAYTTNSIKTNIHDVKKSLNSYEYYSITLLVYLLIMVMMNTIMGSDLEKQNGIYNRVLSTPNTRLELFNYGLINSYFQLLIINLIYVFTFRISGYSFTGSLSILMIIVLIQSFLFTNLGQLIAGILGKKYGSPLVNVFLFYQIFFGGMFVKIDKFQNYRVFNAISKINPNILITNTYRNYLINNNFTSISNYLWITLGLSIILYIINVFVVKMRWGESK